MINNCTIKFDVIEPAQNLSKTKYEKEILGAGSIFYTSLKDLNISSKPTLASENNILVLLDTNNGFIIPAYPGDIDLFTTITCSSLSTFKIGVS